MKNGYFCRKCKGVRNHNILFEKKLRGDEQYIQWIEKFYVVECCGCETISFVKVYGDSEMVYVDDNGKPEYYENTQVYPHYLEKERELDDTAYYYLPQKIGTIYAETINAFKIKSYLLAAGGFRAVIEAVCNHLKIKKGNLATRIDTLFDKGYLTKKETKRLHSIRFIGNDSLHELEVPKREQLNIVFEIINHLLENLFIQDQKVNSSLEVIIDTYEEFIKFLRKKITKDCLNKELSIKDILGKSIRTINKKDLQEFEKQLINDIKAGKNDFLSLSKPETDNSIYKITKIPEKFFDVF